MARNASQPGGLVVRRGHPVISIPDTEDGEPITRLFADEHEARDWAKADTTKRALRAIGSWSHLDADEVLDSLDRIRHESKPTPPIDDL